MNEYGWMDGWIDMDGYMMRENHDDDDDNFNDYDYDDDDIKYWKLNVTLRF